MKFVAVLFLIMVGCRMASAQNTDELSLKSSADQMPQYPGGSSEMIRFINQNIQYPDSARLHGIEGKVVTRFVVNEDGTLSSIEILQGLGYGCDEEVIRLLQLMPKWEPGSEHGKKAKVFYTLPVVFKLGN